MRYIKNITELKEYVFQRLGVPVVQVELFEDQLNIAINDALKKFLEEHYEGTDEKIIFLDIVKDQKEYILDDTVISIKNVFPNTNKLKIDDDENWLLHDIYGPYPQNQISIVDIEVWRQNYRQWELYFNKPISFSYNQTTKKLYFPVIPKNSVRYALQVFKAEDDDGIKRVYDNTWLKEYSVALAGLQWAINISKYSGANLPGGANFNYEIMESRYTAMKEKLELELDEKYSEPTDLFIG